MIGTVAVFTVVRSRSRNSDDCSHELAAAANATAARRVLVDRQTNGLRSQYAWRRLRVRLSGTTDQPSHRQGDPWWPTRTANAVELPSLSFLLRAARCLV